MTASPVSSTGSTSLPVALIFLFAFVLLGVGRFFGRRRLLPGIVAMVVMAVSMPAMAQDAVDVQAFDVSPFQQDLFVTGKGFAREQWQWNLGFYVDYQKAPLVIKSLESGDVVRTIVGNQVTGNLLGAVALTNWFDLGLALPVVMYQDGEGFPGGDSPGVSGIGDLRILPRFQLFTTGDKYFSIGLTPAFTAPTGQLVDPYMGNQSFTFTPWLNMNLDFSRFGLALDLGYLLTKDGNIGDLDLKDELQVRAGIWDTVWPDNLDLIVEALSATASAEPFGNANQSPLELLFGGKCHATESIDVGFGAGVGLTEGYAAPDFRVFAGVMWHTNPTPPVVDSDGDGLVDPDDSCPNDPEDADNFEDSDGCPDPDNDKDGILDGDDKCPNEPETWNNHKDDDGCPDELAKVEGKKIVIMDKVYFYMDKAKIKPESNAVLDAVYDVLQKYPGIMKVRIEGHTDTRGSASYNRRVEFVILKQQL
jgi:hypothetical protein